MSSGEFQNLCESDKCLVDRGIQVGAAELFCRRCKDCDRIDSSVHRTTKSLRIGNQADVADVRASVDSAHHLRSICQFGHCSQTDETRRFDRLNSRCHQTVDQIYFLGCRQLPGIILKSVSWRNFNDRDIALIWNLSNHRRVHSYRRSAKVAASSTLKLSELSTTP